MSTYLIGDIHGCFNELEAILTKANFNPLRDTLWLTGDLVGKGPKSLEVLRLVYELNDSVKIVLGNHELHLLAVYYGIICDDCNDNLTYLLEAPDANILINWLRCQPILQLNKNHKFIMIHAGISPQWDIKTVFKYAKEIEKILSDDVSCRLFLNTLYKKDSPNYWNTKLNKLDRLHFSIKVFTQIRYCFLNGQLEMNCKVNPKKSPKSLYPWFCLQKLISKQYNIVFGHWSSLKKEDIPNGFYGIDTGCCWGGKLTLLHWESKNFIYY